MLVKILNISFCCFESQFLVPNEHLFNFQLMFIGTFLKGRFNSINKMFMAMVTKISILPQYK